MRIKLKHEKFVGKVYELVKNEYIVMGELYR